MKYEIIKSDNTSDLERQVRFMIEHGWTPIGGICATNWGNYEIHREFYQAMIKKESKDGIS